jgi:hypothetical protein
MNQHHETLKHLADAGAGGVALLGIASHFAELINPILTMTLTIASLIWLGIRFREWLHTSKTGD